MLLRMQAFLGDLYLPILPLIRLVSSVSSEPFSLVMALPGTSDPLGRSAASDSSPSLSQTSTLAPEAADSFSESSPAYQPSIQLPNPEATADLDDDVQFIFSAPRRRKKKRRRMDSSHTSTHDFRGLQQAIDPLESVSPSQPLRRGTTGMVQWLQRCHLGDIAGNPSSGVVRSGSLPSVTTTMAASSPPRPTYLNPPSNGKPPLKFFSFAPFMSMPCRSNPNLQLQGLPMARNDWNLMYTESEASSKRKREGEVVHPMPHPTPRSQDERLSTEPSFLSQTQGIRLNPPPCDQFGRPSPDPMNTNSNKISSPTSKMQNLPSITMRSSISTTVGQNIHGSQKISPRTSGSVQPDSSGKPQNDTITVPARLVPEQSVSPRTQTVEISRSPILTQSQARQMTLFRPTMNSPFRQVVEVPNSRAFPAMNRSKQLQIPRSVPPQSLPVQGLRSSRQNPISDRPQNPQTYPSDVLRKPSLYKVPQWSSPLSASPTKSSLTRSPIPNTSVVSSKMGMTSVASGRNHLSDPQQMNKAFALGMKWQAQFSTQSMPVTPPRTPSFQIQRPSEPPSPPPPRLQINPQMRKHSPNLVVDIAETCQENFPFAAIAERHQVPIQKVFDTFSAVIQLPLLRSASDNRRHGSLGRRRIKEFRDARKAMETAMKEKEKESGRRRKKGGKKGPEQPLLRAAILNNASKGKEAGT